MSENKFVYTVTAKYHCTWPDGTETVRTEVTTADFYMAAFHKWSNLYSVSSIAADSDGSWVRLSRKVDGSEPEGILGEFRNNFPGLVHGGLNALEATLSMARAQD